MKIKLCGLTRLCDIDAVNEAMPDYIGFVFAKSRRQVTPDTAAKLKQHLSEKIKAVGVFVNESPKKIADFYQKGIIDFAQLHGSETESDLLALKKLVPHLPLIKALRVEQDVDLHPWQNSCADFLLLDHGAGGTGHSFDWNLIPNLNKPFFLAGGLSHKNILSGIAQTHPYGVDLSSGIETDGLKDRNKILEIVRMVRNG